MTGAERLGSPWLASPRMPRVGQYPNLYPKPKVNTMARISEEFASKWIKAEDLQDEELTLTIGSVEIEDFKEDGGGTKRKVILKFREKVGGQEKAMILNVTNRNTVVKLYGDDTDDWEGKKVTLYPTEVAFDGKMVESIRIKSKAPKAKAAPVAAPAEADDEGDDEIPF